MTDHEAEPRVDHLVDAWRSLPARQQTVLWHYAVLGESEDDVAQRVGEPVSSLPLLLERARLELGVRYREVEHLASVAADLASVER